MSVAWLRHEIHILGPVTNVGPVLALAGSGLIAALMAAGGAPEPRISSSFASSIELGVPLVGGMLAASIFCMDRAEELQRTLQTGYRATLLRRIAILAAWTSLVTVVASIVLDATGNWTAPGSILTSQLSWASPLLWFLGTGMLLGALLRSRSAAASLLAGVWLIQNALDDWLLNQELVRPMFLFMTTHDPDAPDWLATRAFIASIGIVLGGIAVVVASRSERIEQGGDQ